MGHFSKQNGEHRPIRSFVRREGRLTTAQAKALDEILPRYLIKTASGPLDLQQIFANDHPIVMEIGFGNGNLLAEQSGKHPDYNFIGIEVHRPGIGRLLQSLERTHLHNVRIFDQDAMELLQHSMPTKSVSAIWLYFPDPWPKKRHHKRRIVNSHFLDLVARVLIPGGVLHMATDWDNYAEHMRDEINNHPDFKLTSEPDPDGYPFIRPLTHFEQRGKRKGHRVTDLYAIRSTEPPDPTVRVESRQ